MILLGMQMMVMYYFEHSADQLDNQLVSSNAKYTDVFKLEHQVDALEGKLDGNAPALKGTTVAKTFHTLAAEIPDGVWLYKASCNESEGHQFIVHVLGFAKSNELVTLLLKQFQQSHEFTNVNLVRSGLPTESEHAIPVSEKGSQFVCFEVIMTSVR